MTLRRRPLITSLMLAGVAVAGVFTATQVIHAVRQFAYFRVHRDAPIEGWMTIGFVARSYHVSRHALQEALGLPHAPLDPRTLDQIAADRHVALPVIRATLQIAIAQTRAPHPKPAPKR